MPMIEDAPIPLFSFIPAQPNWYVAVFIPAGSETGETWPPRFDLESIIAWKIENARYHPRAGMASTDRIHHVSPITIAFGDMEHCDNDWAIKTPDGRFQLLADRDFDVEAEALKYLQEQHEAAQERLAKKAAK
jgi:hypothetical protein